MITFKASYLGHVLAFGLFADSLIKGSVGMAVCGVAAFAISVAYDFVERHYSTRSVEFQIPEDFKRKVQDLEARVTTIEYGIKARGF
jgi:transketolase C-terminal domain/subunit